MYFMHSMQQTCKVCGKLEMFTDRIKFHPVDTCLLCKRKCSSEMHATFSTFIHNGHIFHVEHLRQLKKTKYFRHANFVGRTMLQSNSMVQIIKHYQFQ